MFGTLGGPELFLILVVALIVFGPRKLPEIGKSMGKMMAEFRRASNEFQQHHRERGRGGEDPRVDADRAAEGRSGRRRAATRRRSPTTRTRERPDDGAGREPARARGDAPERREAVPETVSREPASTPIEPQVGPAGLHGASPSRQDDVPRAPRGAARSAWSARRSRLVRGLRGLLGLPRADLPLHDPADAQGRLPGRPFIFTSPAEALMLYMKMAFFVGIFLAAPYVLWEIWGFISPGLYRTRRSGPSPSSGMGSAFFVLGRALRPLLPVPDHLPLPGRASAGRT